MPAITAKTFAAAAKALRKVSAKDGGSALGEPARDLARLRADPDLAISLSRDLTAARAGALAAIRSALWAGFQREAAAQAEAIGAEYEPDDADRKDAAGLPIAGQTPEDLADAIVARLRTDAWAAIAGPLTGTQDAVDVIAALGACNDRHEKRVEEAAAEADAVGAGAAMRELARALTGSAQDPVLLAALNAI